LRTKPLLNALWKHLKPLFKTVILDPLRALEGRIGYFLPYRYSAIKNDEFLSLVRQLAGTADGETALMLDASAGQASAEAFFAGMHENPNKPLVYCVGGPSRSIGRLKQRYALKSCLNYEIDRLPHRQYGGFGVVLIMASTLPETYTFDERFKGNLVILNEVNTRTGHQIYQELLRDEQYRLTDSNPDHVKGYAIFQRQIDSHA